VSIAAPLYQLTWKDTKLKWEKEEEKAFTKMQDSILNNKTVAFFDPSRTIILHTEASYNQGLSVFTYCKRLTRVYSQCISSVAQ